MKLPKSSSSCYSQSMIMLLDITPSLVPEPARRNEAISLHVLLRHLPCNVQHSETQSEQYNCAIIHSYDCEMICNSEC